MVGEHVAQARDMQQAPEIRHAEDGHLVRRRLLDLLGASTARVTLVVAPSGYGKTTLLRDFTAQSEHPSAWLTLNEWDRDPETLANRLIAAINPVLSHEVAAAAPSTQIDDREGWSRALADRIVAALPAHAVTFVIDDYHEGDGEAGSRSVVESLMLKLPDHARLLIGSRGLPRLASLPRLLARGEASVIDTPVLKFTRDELVEVARLAGDPDPEGAAATLETTTDGWPAAVAIAARSPLRDDVGPGSPELLLRHLIDESLADLDRDELDSVLKLCVFDSLSERLCARVPGLRFDEGLLSWLASTGLPVSSSIEDGEPVYRFHPIFRDHLLRRLTRDLNAYRSAERGAALACLEANQALPALQHFIRADDPDALELHTPRIIGDLLHAGRWAAVIRLFNQVPPSWLDAYPQFRLLFARALFWSGDSDTALEQVAILIDSGLKPDMHAQALALRAGALRKKGEYDAALRTCEDGLALGEREGLTDIQVLEVRRELGFTYGMRGDFPAATQHLAACLQHFEVVQDRENAARIRDGLGVIHGQMGDLGSAAAHLRKALAYWEKLDNPAAASNTHNNIGMVLYKRHDHDEARVEFNLAVEAARQGGNRYIEGVAESSLADLDLDAGQPDSALRRFERSLEVARELDTGSLASYAQSGIARTFLSQGAARKAEAILSEAAAETRSRGGRAELAPILILLARAHVALDLAQEAERDLREAIDLAASPEDQVRARIWLADVLLRHGTKRAAIEELQQAESIAGQHPIWDVVERELKLLPRLSDYAGSRLAATSRLGRMLRSRSTVTSALAGNGSVQVHVLGRFVASINGESVGAMAWRTRRARELLTYLLIEGPRTRKEISLAMWPEDTPESAASTFKVTLHRLRRAIKPVAIELRGDRHHLVAPQPIWCDAVEFRRLVREARSDTADRERLLREAVEAYGGPLAREFDSEWAEQARSALEDEYIGALGQLAELLAAAGNHAESVTFCEMILAIDPLNDAAALRLMQSHAALGQATAAADAFGKYRRKMNAEGLEPSPAIIRLYKQIQSNSA